ncbi:hypothetical protein D3C71_2181600 [compost metagenome]
MNLARNLGFIAGAALMAAVYAAGVRYGHYPADLASSHGMRVTFGLAAGMVMMAFLLSRRAGR